MNKFIAEVTFSVIIPYYNNAQTIHRCLTSVSKQTLKPLEILVVDDGSHDEELLSVCNFFNAKLITLEKNSGSGNARSIASKLAVSTHVALLDADDSWLPTHLKTHYELWSGVESVTAAISTSMIISNNFNEFETHHSKSVCREETYQINPKALAFSNPFWNSATTINLMHLRSVNFWSNKSNFSYAEDYQLLADFIQKELHLRKSKEITGTYYLHKNSKSTNVSEVFASRINVSLKILQGLDLDWWEKIFLSRILRTYLIISYVMVISKFNQSYSKFIYPQLGKSLIITIINVVFGNKTLWHLTKTLIKISPKFRLRKVFKIE